MPALISFKKSFLFLLAGIACSAGAAFLLVFLLAGPILSPVYDFFLSYRQPPPISREILIINTEEFTETSDIFSVLMTLTEMEASNLFLAARVSGSASPVTGTETEIRRRFYDEYILLGNNIRNLFEAIRLGSVQPAQAPLYIEQLVELTEQSRERLLSVLIDRDEDLVRSAAVFGNFMEVEVKPVIDWDGKIRRANPVEMESTLEHPVYSSLKHRYAASQIENSEFGYILVLRKFNEDELEIFLDREGNIITPFHGGDFRRIDSLLFRQYEEADSVMRQTLRDANDLGAFSMTLPEQSPLFIEEYAFVLREELLKSPDSEKRSAWIESRANYFKSLLDFLYGSAESLLVSGYEEMIAGEDSLDEEGLARLINMRDELILSFFIMRETYNELIQIRNILQSELASSFCIMGPQNNADYCAFLANALITGSHIRPVLNLYALYWIIAPSFLILLIIFRMRPSLLLLMGFVFSVIAAAGFGGYFIYSAYWVDPAIVFGASFTGTLVIFFCKRITIRHRARRFRIAYGSAVNRDTLRKLIARGRPDIHEKTVVPAAILVIRDFNLLNTEEREKSTETGEAQKLYYETVRKIVFDAGAVIAGYHGDTIIVCFGSPLDIKDSDNPCDDACILVKKLLLNKKSSWRFGLDTGKCTFSWTPETGFTVNGRPVGRAKILASKNARFNTRALITNSLRDLTALKVRKVGTLLDETDAFYELTV